MWPNPPDHPIAKFYAYSRAVGAPAEKLAPEGACLGNVILEMLELDELAVQPSKGHLYSGKRGHHGFGPTLERVALDRDGVGQGSYGLFVPRIPSCLPQCAPRPSPDQPTGAA